MSSATSNAPGIGAEQCSTRFGAMHATNATDATNERVQDQGRNSSVPEHTTGPVDKSSRVRSGMASSFVEVRTPISVEHYKQLNALAREHQTTVGALVGELTRRALSPKKIGRPTKYTPALGERIWDARWMHRAWEQIAAEEHIAVETAKKYHDRYDTEHKGGALT